MKRTIALLLILCLFVCCLSGCKNQTDTPPILTDQKAEDDFSDMFKTASLGADALAAITVQKIEKVSDIIEYYDVTDTTYTKVTALLNQEFTSQIKEDTLTIYILGTTENFPSREAMVEGRSYLLRLESWVHESGRIWLVSPLESTYLRIFEGEILVHKTASDLNYHKTLTLDAFEKQYKEYLAQHPTDPTAQQKHYEEILTTLESYNYKDEQLTYHLDSSAIEARKKLAKMLIG